MLKVANVSFAYEKELVLQDISFKIKKGEHVSVIGESGCGKSTLLKVIYGLLHVVEGEVYWGANQIMGPLFNLVPGEAYMKYLSQDFDLMPFTSVKENISQYLSAFRPKELKKRTGELLEMIELTEFADTKVSKLSGGQQQRVALARVLAQEPEIILLDEPFSHIDNFSKNSLRRNVFSYLKEKEISCLTATHDHNDVLPFADRIIVLKDKHVLANEKTLKLYEQPKDLYIASLFGEANLIPVNIVKSYTDTTQRIIVYAHEFKVSKNSGLKTVVKKAYLMGNYFLVEGIAEGEKVFFNSDSALEPNTTVFLNVSLETLNKRLGN
ncbi:ABC transporter ATP-binding protein [Muriicola sp. Z0-33]|uniref:ABC transporter ATP-binding protein n=1 Tax=Muriicola sp. Z0-33 TaxID=2816957 RepID=UPI002238E7CA|nr:ABC transporter ATP-binding protein [Muriicola sp. Z0-33]MCW5514790.1 ABC transporter ATP-binding protein [Muriicola sp. Z0-33]